MDSASEGADYTLDTQPPTNVSESTISERQPTAAQEGDTPEEPLTLAGAPQEDGLQDIQNLPSLPRRSTRVSRRPDWYGVPIQFSDTDVTDDDSQCGYTFVKEGV